jgi:hypothetical protein
MTPHTHLCAAVCCPKQVPLNLLMCMAHWKLVPEPTKREVMASWLAVQRQPDAQHQADHAFACGQAVALVQAKQLRKIQTKAAADGVLFD